MSKEDKPEFNLDVVKTKEAASILKESRKRGSRTSKYTPIYDAIRDLNKGEFVVLREVDKSAKLGIYQGVKRNFDDEVRMASARERDSSSESFVLVIGRATDYDELRELAKNA